MGKLERKSARLGPGKGTLRGRQHLKKVILSYVALTGLLAVGLVAQNVIGSMAKLGIISTKRQREYVNVSCRRLIRQGLLEQKGGRVYLTSEGRKILRHLELADFKLKSRNVGMGNGGCWYLIFRRGTVRYGTRFVIRSHQLVLFVFKIVFGCIPTTVKI